MRLLLNPRIFLKNYLHTGVFYLYCKDKMFGFIVIVFLDYEGIYMLVEWISFEAINNRWPSILLSTLTIENLITFLSIFYSTR